MNDLIVQQIFYYVHGVWRRRWIVLLVSWFVCVAGWTFVASLPDVYESSARVYVDTSGILRPLLKGIAVEDNVDDEIFFIERTLTSRPNLEKIARMTDLDITATTPSETERLLERIKDHTTITLEGENLYFVGFNATDPRLAKNVVQSYLTLFVESNLGQSRRDSDAAGEFLDEQIKQYEAQLTTAERRLAEFKQENAGLLPGERGFQVTLATALRCRSPEDHKVDQRIRAQPVRAVHRDAARLTDGHQARHDALARGSVRHDLAVVVGRHSAHVVVHGRQHGNRRLRDIHASENPGRLGNAG